MRITERLLAVLCCLALCCAASPAAFAKDLEVCRLCGGKGEYHCDSCGNTGTLTCGGCGGSGVWICPGEEDKGKCDNGYYICPNCQGKGFTQNYDEKGNPTDTAPCGYGSCGGSGRIECWHCHGAGGGVCDKCGGTGLEECQNGNCQRARRYGWKCPDCKGTGFILLGNPMPPKESNDGVRNLPAKGDYIVTNDKTWAGYTYTGDGRETPASSTSKATSKPTSEPTAAPTKRTEPAPSETEPVPTETEPLPTETEPVPSETESFPAETEPAETEPPQELWILDCGEGRFDMDGFRPVFVWMDGHTVSGEEEVGMDTPIRLEDLVPECMLVFLKGEDGYSAQLIPDQEGNVCLSRRQPEDGPIPRRVRLTVEFFSDEVPGDGEPEGGLPERWPLFAAAAGALAVVLILIILKKRRTGAKT